MWVLSPAGQGGLTDRHILFETKENGLFEIVHRISLDIHNMYCSLICMSTPSLCISNCYNTKMLRSGEQ